MTTNLLFGKSGIQGYFTPYVSKEINNAALDGWVGEAFDLKGKLVWFLDEDGKVVNTDLQGYSLETISLNDFLESSGDDQDETDNKQWPQDLLDWADATQFDAVVVYRD